MKTLVIWDRLGEEPIQFFVVHKDITHLNRVYLNEYTQDKVIKAKQAELQALVYNDQGDVIVTMTQDFPMDVGVKVIVCGFLP